MDLGLKGKVVLVTGASRGIGRAIAEAFATEGAHVAIAARNAQEVQAVAAQIARQTKATVEAFATDVMQADQIKELVDHAAKRFGTIHILVNNAGGVGAFAPFEQLTDDDWLEILNLNVLSAVRATRAALPFMQKQKWGRIINI